MPDARERHLATIHVHPDFDFSSEEEAKWFVDQAGKAIQLLFGAERVIVDSEVRPRMPHV